MPEIWKDICAIVGNEDALCLYVLCPLAIIVGIGMMIWLSAKLNEATRNPYREPKKGAEDA